MKRIEMIRLRTSAEEREKTVEIIREQFEKKRQIEGVDSVFLMKHAQYGGDIALLVVWDTTGEVTKTREGVAVAEAIGRFGTVDHSIWEVVSRKVGSSGELVQDYS